MNLTDQTCLLGYSEAAALNQAVGSVSTNHTGYWSGRKHTWCLATRSLSQLQGLNLLCVEVHGAVTTPYLSVHAAYAVSGML